MPNTDGFSRRKFIKTGIAAGAFALSAKSYAQASGANSRLNVGFIGCGGMANSHLNSLLKMAEGENLHFPVMCDVFPRQAQRFMREVERSQGYEPEVVQDYRKVLDNPDVDYVVIATPEHSHAYITLDALDAGKHIYVEKPVTHTIEEGQAVLAKTRETGLQVQVGVQGMADDSYAAAYTAIREGKIGSVVNAQIDYVRKYTDKGPWRKGIDSDKAKPDDLDWEAWLRPAPAHPWDPHRYEEWRCYSDYSGGIATDLFIHRMTRILKACGLTFPKRVVGMGGIYTWPDGRDLPDSLELLAEYPAIEGVTNGMTVHVLGTMANDDPNAHCIRGTEATLWFNSGGWEIKTTGSKGEVLETHKKTGGEDVTPHHINHHAAIREGAELNCPVELGLYGVAVCRMANLSWESGKTMAWDWENNKAVEM